MGQLRVSPIWIAAVLVSACGAPDLTFRDDYPPAMAVDAGASMQLDASVGSDAAPDTSQPTPDGSLVGLPDAAPDVVRDAVVPTEDADAALLSTCSNGVKDGDETSVDCGGAECPTCEVGRSCAHATDCTDGVCLNNICRASSCSDGMRNGQETDIDCGGAGTCKRCEPGQACASNADCSSSRCDGGGHCAIPTCADGVKNDGETDTDCGGTCPACADGLLCKGAVDCRSSVCTNGHCTAAACGDGVKNGSETGKDCGGPSCAARCPIGQGCQTGADCASGSCVSSVCQNAGCSDGVKNGTETDVDCGGAGCARCADGKACLSSADCASSVCSGTCQVASCADGVMNGGETDTDCGGGCKACAGGASCLSANDCSSKVCANGKCVAPSCTDGVMNGNETDIDCAGGCSACTAGRLCGGGADCTSGVCVGSVCQAPSCADRTENGDETGVDCGGSCPVCVGPISCSGATDCESRVCVGNVCQAASCTDGVRNGGESDIDCGAACGATLCPAGKACGSGSDCQSGNCLAGTCSYCRAGMMAVPKPSSGNYCVDATEVSQARYATWLQTNPPTTGQTSMCSANGTYQPATIGNSCTTTTYAPTVTPNAPVVCVDFCDAAAYCTAHGNRLCGAIAGGSVGQPSIDDATVSQWYRACTAAGARTLPYGSTYFASACNGADRSSAPVDVGSLASCMGGYAGLLDMSGNVSEWEDACKAQGNPRCQIRGGSFKDHETGLVCSSNTQVAYDTTASYIGFRCCSD
jgi:hypothetical protein